MTEPAQMVDEVPPEASDTTPNSQVYSNPDPTINPTPSTVVTPIQGTPSGVYSHNPLLSHNPSELWRHLLSNLKPPQMIIQVKGKIGPVEDDAYEKFSLSMDVSNEVDPQWSRILTTDGSTSTIAGTLEKYYTSSINQCKEFRLKKVVIWDKERVIRLIKGVVKEATSGRFRGEAVKVKFRVSDGRGT